MLHPKGGPAPFFLSTCTSRLRDDALLTRALESFAAGRHADALLAAEYVCRRLPMKSIPAILRAKILQTGYPFMAARAWHAAWLTDAENPLLQDIMLQSWLKDGGRPDVASLGPAFLPARCRANRHAGLLPLLRAAGIRHTGACWKDGDAIEAMVFLEGAAKATLVLSDESGEVQVQAEVPGDGSRFRLAPPRPGAVWSLTLLQPDGRRQLLPGSPLAFYPPPVAHARATAQSDAPDAARPVAIVVPVYRELALVRACLESVTASLAHNRTPARIVVIDDASPEPALSAWLDKQAAAGAITLLRNPYNLGFIETTNRGMRMFPDHDVLLLNADTQVHGDWIDRLACALYAQPDVASVTPWTNNGEISSFPVMSQAAPAPTTRELALLDAAAAEVRAAGGQDVELPSCCGFTMLIRRTVLDAIGMLDGSTLVRGYGEEVDWCMRARAAGWRHLQATGVFVAHAGTVSFRAEKTLRVAQNRSVVVARYPDYYPEFAAFVLADPLRGPREALRKALAAAPTGAAWLRKAETAQPGAALPQTVARKTLPASLPALSSSCARIAIWRHDATSKAARQVLALARLIASRPQCGLRLLVIGDGSEALWHTGVVDHVPALAGDAMPLLDDAHLLQAAGCRAVLATDPAGLPSRLRPVLLGDSFDAVAWLNDWTTRNAGAKTA